jgi:hypothetical protein
MLAGCSYCPTASLFSPHPLSCFAAPRANFPPPQVFGPRSGRFVPRDEDLMPRPDVDFGHGLADEAVPPVMTMFMSSRE